MAKRLSIQPTSFNEYPKSISRQGPYPWDREGTFFKLGEHGDTDVTTAYGYAKAGAQAYVGQSLEVVDADRGIIGFYQITDEAGHLKEVGQKLLSGADEEDGEDNQGWTGGKIKAWVIRYIDENGGVGGGGGYNPAAISFTGIGTKNIEFGDSYSITKIGLTITSLSLISSDIELTAVMNSVTYSYSLPKSSVGDGTNVELLLANFINASGTSLMIDESSPNQQIDVKFTATATDKSGSAITGSGSYVVNKFYYMYIGSSNSDIMDGSKMISLQNNNLTSVSQVDVSLIANAGDYIWICLPTNKNLSSILMGGFDVTSDFDVISTLNACNSHTSKSITSYRCYRTKSQQTAGTYNLSVKIS